MTKTETEAKHRIRVFETGYARFYYPQGQVNRQSDDSSFKFYYTRDHLGSVRDVTTETGALLARFALIQLNRRSDLSARAGGGRTRPGAERGVETRDRRHLAPHRPMLTLTG